MNLPRRSFLQLVAGAASLTTGASAARAQAYPSRPVRIVVTFPPGGSNDFHARLVGQWLSERLGQPFIIENRPGAGGNVGMEAVARATPDGHTLVLLSVGIAINAAFHEKLSWDLIRDIAPVASFYRSSYVLAVNPSLPAQYVAGLIDYAKANPGRINFGSNGVGGTGHLAGEMFKMMTGAPMQHVPYRGEAPALTDLVTGQMHVMFATLTATLPFIRGGQLRALAVTSPEPTPMLPGVPPIAATVPGFEIATWAGLGAPNGTPSDTITRLNATINAGLESPQIKARYTDLGLTLNTMSPAAFGRMIAADVQRWREVIQFSGLKPG